MFQTKWMHGAVKYLFSNVGEVCKVCKVVFLRVGGHNASMVNFRRVMLGCLNGDVSVAYCYSELLRHLFETPCMMEVSDHKNYYILSFSTLSIPK